MILKCLENCHIKKISNLLYTYTFFEKPTKKINNRAKYLYFNATILLSIFHDLLAQKKMKTGKWPKAADASLYTKSTP